MRWRAVAAVVLAMLVTGCTRTTVTRIKPAELPKIASHEGRKQGRELETTDGRWFRVRGYFDAVVVVPQAGAQPPIESTHRHPVQAEIAGDKLLVTGAPGPACGKKSYYQRVFDQAECQPSLQVIALEEVERVDIREERVNVWPIFGGVVGFVAGGLGGFLLGPALCGCPPDEANEALVNCDLARKYGFAFGTMIGIGVGAGGVGLLTAGDTVR